ncbi:unnamed protein product [Boreogadus saida]
MVLMRSARRQRLEPDEAQRLKREAWRAASRRYYARKMARLRAHRPPQGQLHPLGASASACFMPASMTTTTTHNNNSNSSSMHHHHHMNSSSRKRRATGQNPPDHLDLAHFLQDTQPSGMSGPQS